MWSHLARIRAVINQIVKIRFKYKETLSSKALRVLGSQERPCVMERGNSDFPLTAVRFSPIPLYRFSLKMASETTKSIPNPSQAYK